MIRVKQLVAHCKHDVEAIASSRLMKTLEPMKTMIYTTTWSEAAYGVVKTDNAVFGKR